MYPLEVSQPYPHNQWYVAAYAHEVSRTIMERTLLDQPVIFFRTEPGEAVAMQGLCPHRFFPLVKGELVGDTIQCAYHGLAFGADGRCVRIPSQSEIPSRYRSRTYPVVERGQLIWIWMGDAEAADPANIPDADCLNPDEYELTLLNYVHTRARYQLLIDNLFDLSHIDFLHGKTAPPNNLSKFPVKLTEYKGAFRAVRECGEVPYEGYASFLFGPGEGTIPFEVPTDYHGPALIVSGTIHKRRPGQGQASGGGAMRNVHLLTPETLHSTHYFGGFARNFRKGDEEFTRVYKEFDHAVRKEDAEGLGELEPNLDRFASVKAELSVRADAGAIRVRRLLSEQIRAEYAAT
jgi:vanillate O-demethylase monooxygenase subunit